MDEMKRRAKGPDAGRGLPSNPRVGRASMRAGFQSLPSATVAHFLRRVPPVNSSPNAEPANLAPNRRDEGRDEVSGSRLASGAPFAGYTILRPLGAGGMAEVYLALHPGCRGAM